jgi:hypothetical protein
VALKAVLDSIEDLDDTTQALYDEKDGKFYLDLDDSIKTHVKIMPLSNALQNVKKEKKELADALSEARSKLESIPETFDPEVYERLLDDEKKREEDPNYKRPPQEQVQQMKEQYESRIRNMTDKHAIELAERDALTEREVTQRERELAEIYIEEGLTKALVAQGVDSKYLKATRAYLKPSIKMVRDEDTGKRRAIVETDMGDEDVEKFVENWAKSDEGRPFVPAPSGGGAKGSGNGRANETNPWSKENFNLTQQGMLLKSGERAKAERFMRAAGIPQHEIAQQLAGGR